MQSLASSTSEMRQRGGIINNFSSSSHSDTSMGKKDTTTLWAAVIGIALLIGIVYFTTQGKSGTTIQSDIGKTRFGRMGSSISALTNPESFNSGPWYIVDEKLANTEYIYQFPSTERSEWKGIIALFHGCSHSATDFWDKSTVCEKCLGLPQEKNLVESFINANYVVLAISSQNRVNKCWNDHDISFIYAIISQFRSQNRLNNDLYPLFAFGASSGGSIVSQLAMKKEFSDNFMGLSGVVIQISAFRINDLGKIQIPIMFDYMTRDERLADVIANIIETNDKRDENEKITIRSNGIIPHIIDASYFSQEIGSPMTSKLSSQIYDAFKMAGILDENDMLQQDPRQSDWRSVLNNAHLTKTILKETGDTLIADQSPISELMNVAWARHEISSQHCAEMLKFFDELSSQYYT